MDTIASFISKDEEIARLNKQLSMVAKFYDDFYKVKIKSLTKERNKIQHKHNRLRESKRKERPAYLIKEKAKAKAMLWAKSYGELDIEHADIANQCLTSLATINALSIEVNNEKLQVNS